MTLADDAAEARRLLSEFGRTIVDGLHLPQLLGRIATLLPRRKP